MFNSCINNDGESVDYDYFESEGNHIKVYGDLKQSNYSKIVTKAVIENNPSKMIEFKNNSDQSNNLKIKNSHNKDDNNSKTINNHEIVSSPSSSLEEKFINRAASLDESLLNCLAYNDDSYENHEITSFSLEDKEGSNNSLSESTITTVTSDFTSVSLFSCLSDSSCLTDSSLDSSTSEKNNDTEHCQTDLNLNELDDNIKSTQEGNDFENISNQNFSDKIDYESCGERKQSLNDKCINDNTNVEEIFENGCSENHYQNVDNEVHFGSEQLQGSIESDGESDCGNDNYAEKQVFTNDDDGNSNGSILYESDYERESIDENESTFEKNFNISILEEDLEDISLATQLRSKSCSLKTPPLYRGSSRTRVRRKECNMSFSREELIKIERDNLTLLKKIMAHAKPRTITLNQPFCHKKTSAAINRIKQQKKIDQDNYILYSKINALGRMKRVF